jgi:hypothetical protein
MQQYYDRLSTIFDLWAGRGFRNYRLARPNIVYTNIPEFCRFEAGPTPNYLINEKLMGGEHPDIKAGDKYIEGRFNFTADAIVHCMAQHAAAVTNHPAQPNRINARNICNVVGQNSNMSKVRALGETEFEAIRRPLAAFWPWNARHPNFYQSACTVDWLAREILYLIKHNAVTFSAAEWSFIATAVDQGLAN